MWEWSMQSCKSLSSGHEAKPTDILDRGALLSDDTGIAVGVGVVSAVLAAILEFMAFRHLRQYSKVHDLPSTSSSHIALSAIEQ